MQLSFRLLAEVEARFTSIERLFYYIHNVKPEGEFNTKKIKQDEEQMHKNDSKWRPENGSIEYESVSVSSNFKLVF